MATPMILLRRAPNDDWFAHKFIPKDVRRFYKVAFGVSQEERFHHSASIPFNRARVELREWDGLVSRVISTGTGTLEILLRQ